MRQACVRRSRRRVVFVTILICVLVVVTFAALLFNPHGQYERTHDLPNPYWALFTGTYTYTYEAGPPGHGLVDRRPDVAVLTYVRQYIGDFGSYPCHGQVGDYTAAHLLDTICPPPVADVEVTSTTVGKVNEGAEGQNGTPVAYVSLLVHYADGTTADRTITLFPRDSSFYFFSWVHLNCWRSGETDAFYNGALSGVPAGLSYYPGDATTRTCHK